MSSTLEASVFMGKNYSDNSHSIKNTGMKQMFDISEKLIVEQSDEIFGVTPTDWEDSSWKHFFFGQWWRSHQILAREGLCIFRFCVMPWKDESEPNIKFCFGKKNWVGSRVHHNTELWTGFTILQLCNKVQEFINKMGDPAQFQGRIIFMSMFNDISWGSEDNGRECNANADLVSIYARRCPAGLWSFLGPGSEKKWYSTDVDRPQGEWDRVAELMMIKFGESGHPVFRATSPLSRGTLKSKGGGKLSFRFCADADTIETVFAQ